MISNNQGEQIAHGAGTAVAFLIGGIVGAAVGLLVAPCSGADTRRKLGDAASRAAGKVRENVDRVRDDVDAWKHKAESRLAGMADSTKTHL